MLPDVPACCDEDLHGERLAEKVLGFPKEVRVTAGAEGDVNGLPARGAEMAGPEMMVPGLPAARCAQNAAAIICDTEISSIEIFSPSLGRSQVKDFNLGGDFDFHIMRMDAVGRVCRNTDCCILSGLGSLS